MLKTNLYNQFIMRSVNVLLLVILDVLVYKLDKVSLGCVFPLWAIVTIALGGTLLVVVAVVVNRKWTLIKFRFYARFTNNDDSQDLTLMKYDAFVSYRLLLFHWKD